MFQLLQASSGAHHAKNSLNNGEVGLNNGEVGLNNAIVGLGDAKISLNFIKVGPNNVEVDLNFVVGGLNNAIVGLNFGKVCLNNDEVGINIGIVGLDIGTIWLVSSQAGPSDRFFCVVFVGKHHTFMRERTASRGGAAAVGRLTMSDLWPILVICIWGPLCCATVFQGSRLLRRFRERYPAIAARELPMAWDTLADPKRATFFLGKRAVEVLRPLPDIWRERQLFVTLVCVTIGFWLACGLGIVVLGILT